VADPIRFFFDQHVSRPAAIGLRRHGVDVVTAHEVGHSRTPDDELLRLATADGRSVVTHDTDFLNWATDFLVRGEPFAGVVFGRAEAYDRRPGQLIRDLLTLHGVYTAADMLNHVEYL
jgi:predicted nuclease of predicted toxin-antitoxin system